MRPKEYYELNAKEKGVLTWEKTLVGLRRLFTYVEEYQECRENLEIAGAFQHYLAQRPDQKFVTMFFESFKEQLESLPIMHRVEIFNLCRVRKYNFLQRVLTNEDQESDMYFICSGKANKIQTEDDYLEFAKTEK